MPQQTEVQGVLFRRELSCTQPLPVLWAEDLALLGHQKMFTHVKHADQLKH